MMKATNRPPFTAEERVDRIDVLLFAIVCVAGSGSHRVDDPDNENEINTLAQMARDEVKQLETGLTVGKAMNLDCGI